MHKFAFCWGSAADPIEGALSPDLLTVFTGPTTKGTEGKWREGEEGRERKSKGERREKRWKEGFGPPKNFGMAPSMLLINSPGHPWLCSYWLTLIVHSDFCFNCAVTSTATTLASQAVFMLTDSHLGIPGSVIANWLPPGMPGSVLAAWILLWHARHYSLFFFHSLLLLRLKLLYQSINQSVNQ